MSAVEDARREAERRLEESRRQAVESLAAVRTVVEEEIGWVPRRAPWILALVAGAGGFALGLKALKRRSKRPSRR
jgi:hypothetical protein